MRVETAREIRGFMRVIRPPVCHGCGKRIVGKILGYGDRVFPSGTVEKVPLCKKCLKNSEEV